MKDQIAARALRMLKPSFMRPQLVTWKSTRKVDASFMPDTVFARASGISLGMFANEDEVAMQVRISFMDSPVHLHVFPRVVPEDGVPDEVWKKVDETRAELLARLQKAKVKVLDSPRPQDGDFVLDVILGEPGEKIFLGVHVHGPLRHPLPGSLPRLKLCPDAPSRAWLKIEQALIWARLDGPKFLKGKTALELGCAPGGATLSLLRRGMNVVGVDTGEMDPAVLAEAEKRPGSFRQLRIPASDLRNAKLPRPVHLLISDMNVAPPIMLREIEGLQSRLLARVLILTMKINDRSIEQSIPRYLKQIAQFAPSPVRAVQLPSNRSEFCVVAGGV